MAHCVVYNKHYLINTNNNYCSFDVLKYCFICVLKVYHLEDVIEKTGYRVDEDSPYALRLHSLIKV